jgi:hypothetical protein
MGAMSRRKGATAERDVARYLRPAGFGGAERAVRTGYQAGGRVVADPGDITGTPGIIWSVKDCATERLNDWLAELDAMDGFSTDVRLLVHKRAGKADPARWWCWMRLNTLMALNEAEVSADLPNPPLRMELQHVIPLLHAAGYGDAITEESA